ncbi:MAG: polysaccharide deacetylase family protein [Candidatus Delongbacteria bacterium]|nr:polysaccharide deacetylase family protein [Candidatus Delongbacteria bacterium]
MSPIKIKISNDFVPEKEYVLDFVFRDILGVEFTLSSEDRNDYLIELPNGKSITLFDHFFRNAESNYIKAENIPEDVNMLNCGEVSEIPIIFGSDQMFINEKNIKCGFDIVATIFFMLSRWEEIAITEKDEHGRFPGKLSLAVKENFIDRPIVNEYVLLIKSFIEELDPSVAMKEQESKITLTSDIDDYKKYSNFNISKKLAGDIVKRYSPKMFYQNFREFCMKFLLNSKDPYDTFEELIELSELTTEKPIFFIPVAKKSQFDSGWFTGGKDIVNTAKFIQEHGGEIGLHYGYDSISSVEKIIAEKELLEKKLNIKVNSNRAHFLRFNIKYSFDDLESSGITKDYSLGYSKYTGFRCGTSYPFKAWNFKTRKSYDVEVHPLIVMDATLNSHQEMSKKEMAAEVKKYKKLVENFGGNLVLLLHNSSPKDVFDAFKDALK